MKLNLKMIAVAVAMVATGSANAALVNQGTGNGSLVLYAFNTATNAYYVRDLGFSLNTFLPSSAGASAGDNAVGGDKTPNAGVTLDKTNTSSFADQSAFTSWLGQQSDVADVRWSLFGGDSTTTGVNGVARLLVASTIDLNPTNGQIRNANGTATGSQGLNVLNPGMGLSSTGTALPSLLRSNSLLNIPSLASIGQAASVYYFTATTQTGSSAEMANKDLFDNATGVAQVLLNANGDFSYTLAGGDPVSQVPLPAAAWLLGSGLVGLGGMIRRRKAADKA